MKVLLHAPSDLRIAYHGAFEAERLNTYPVVDAFEDRMGVARLDKEFLELAARVLACPLKKHPPNWQHGRILYSLARWYLLTQTEANILDIGSAKGFSALCLMWALMDSDVPGSVTSVDVLDPTARIRRNTVAELDGYLTLAETLQPWTIARLIQFKQSTGEQELASSTARIHICFIDGKHDGAVVQREGYLLAMRQMIGDLVMFDDVHLPDVWSAVKALRSKYDVERIDLLPHRAYAIGVRRG